MAALLVTASPSLIPSNGTIGSVISATFACDTTPPSTPFPLSPTGTGNAGVFLSTGQTGNPTGVLAVAQPLITGEAPICGAGLPGGFTFSAPRGVIFDNGRTVKGVGCGLDPNANSFGGTTPFTPYHTTAPLAFTCTGASVLAVGSGAATTAAINVVYNSAVGGLTAAGSTVVTIVPAPSALQRTLTCAPPTIAAGGPGSVCAASVTDPSGIPLSGLTGATVTWTTTDSSRSVVEACPTGGSIPVPVTAPRTTGLVATQPRCQVPTASTPSQNSTLVNGQASALVVSPAGSAPGPVSISTAIDTVVPPSAACADVPYIPAEILPLTYGTGAPAVTGCGVVSAPGASITESDFVCVQGSATLQSP